MARKVAGALAVGCNLILKPSEEIPAAAVYLARALAEAGLGEAVLDLVFGSPDCLSRYPITYPAIRLLTFTGSVPVGKKLADLEGEYMKPCIMELGEHAPVVVCSDVGPVYAAIKSAVAKSSNAGQICTAPTRWFVDESVFETFASKMAERAKPVKVGDGLNEETNIGHPSPVRADSQLCRI